MTSVYGSPIFAPKTVASRRKDSYVERREEEEEEEEGRGEI